jgi:hypothetical protein
MRVFGLERCRRSTGDGERYGMGTRITVTVKGAHGIDDPELLRAELDRKTGLQWYRDEDREARSADGHLGVALFILGAVASGLAGKSVEMAAGVIEGFLESRIHRPEVSIETDPAEDPKPDDQEEALEPQAPQETGGPESPVDEEPEN